MVSVSSLIYLFKTTLTACVIALHFLPFSVYIVNKLLLFAIGWHNLFLHGFLCAMETGKSLLGCFYQLYELISMRKWFPLLYLNKSKLFKFPITQYVYVHKLCFVLVFFFRYTFMSHYDAYRTHGPQLQGIKKVFIKLYFYLNGCNCRCYCYQMPKKCKCQVVNLPCKTQCCCCFCVINEVRNKDYHNNEIIRVSHFRVWHRKNPQMFLKPREEERKRFVLLMYSLYSSYILL